MQKIPTVPIATSETVITSASFVCSFSFWITRQSGYSRWYKRDAASIRSFHTRNPSPLTTIISIVTTFIYGSATYCCRLVSPRMSIPVLKNPIDFTQLLSVNSDIVGWLRIRALDISYPVVQGKDNDYYLHRTFEKTDNFAGCLFVNSYNMGDFTDQNTIIYGHNMKNGSMFGKLKNFVNDFNGTSIIT